MIQQSHPNQEQTNKIIYKANPRYSQSFVRILQVLGGVIRKVAVGVLIGFHNLVESTEQHHPSHQEYWWNSPDVVDDLMKR